MKKTAVWTWIIAALTVLQAAALELDKSLHCGKAVEVRLTADDISQVHLDRALAAGNLKPEEMEMGEIYVQRPPEEGTVYAILTVELERGKSVGKHDFHFIIDDMSFRCKGLSRGEGPFDPRLQEVVGEDGGETVKLLFEVPAGTAKAELDMALPVSYPLANVEIPFIALDEDDQEENSETAEEPEAATADAGTEGDAAEGTAAEPEPEEKTVAEQPKQETKDDGGGKIESATSGNGETTEAPGDWW